jgi:hypothetical protein
MHGDGAISPQGDYAPCGRFEAGIRGEAMSGGSDRPVSPERFGATLLHALGVPPETRLAADGFTRPASAGQPILELFG